MPATFVPSELRPALHAKVDQLEGEALAILHHVALQLELDQLVGEVDGEFDTIHTFRLRERRLGKRRRRHSRSRTVKIV
jgi:hypothetical protein